MTHALHSPLTTHLINRLRDAMTDAEQFRRLVKQLTLLLADAAFKSDDLKPVPLGTWQGEDDYALVDESEIVLVTILRAGLPMLDAAMELFPKAASGFLAMKRDETTHEAKLYYDRVPDCRGKHVVVVDPMVATGGSLIDAVTLLRKKAPAKLTSLHIIASPEGVAKVTESHPDLAMFIAQIDRGLSSEKFILPGLGDAGDRAFNTL
ncbi:uracil phosphoribosyltransferase [Thiomicrolovo sp. ZZH C-3]